MEKSVPARRDSSEDARRKAGGAKGRRIERANRVGRGVAESPETSGSGAKLGFPRGKDPEDSGFCSEENRRRQDCSPATKTKLSKVQPPDAENRTSGGGEGLRGETPRSPIRSWSPARPRFLQNRNQFLIGKDPRRPRNRQFFYRHLQLNLCVHAKRQAITGVKKLPVQQSSQHEIDDH